MNNIPDIRAACARILNGNSVPGTAFLISSQIALTAETNISSVNNDDLILEFPHGNYRARVNQSDASLGCAVLFLEKPVEDVIPLRWGIDVTFGDAGIFYGYPILLHGPGLFFDGRVQDTATPIPISRDDRPPLILFPAQTISGKFYDGLPGSPLIVGEVVVGLLIAVYIGAAGTAECLIFRKIQDALSLLPIETASRMHGGSHDKKQDETNGKPEIVIISALDEELDYLYEQPLQWSEPRLQSDGINYRRARFIKDLDIIAVSARSMGLTATAILTAKVLKEWKPSIVAMIGICGGRKEKGINIGDIVVANECFHYQFGAFENGKIHRELRVENVDSQIIDLVEHLTRRTKILLDIQQSLPRGFKKPNTMLQCHIGPIASADLVVKDIEKFGEAVEAERKTLAIDMESYAFMRAARLADTRWILVLKSVSDFADAKKDDEFREYAKYTSASLLMTILESLVAGRNI